MRLFWNRTIFTSPDAMNVTSKMEAPPVSALLELDHETDDMKEKR